MPKPKYTKIDGVNYVERVIPTVSGDMRLEGMTVRALRNALTGADPDDLVCYMAEQTEESRKADLLFGGIAGVGMKSEHGVVLMFGPEAVKATKREGQI